MIEAKEISISVKPKLAFLGVGWIGKHRLESIAAEDKVEVAYICDQSQELVQEVKEAYQKSSVIAEFNQLIAEKPDGIAIATPSALHAAQTLEALNNGIAVFCQKPLARTAGETKKVVEAAAKNNKLLAVDFSYRYTKGIEKVKEIIDSGKLGKIFSADLVFHNAYGPDKSWYFDPALSGGGCLMDLGVHLVDLIFYLFPDAEVENINSFLSAKGKPVLNTETQVEDFASAKILLTDHLNINLDCSWHISAGKDAVIEATCYGSEGGITFRNVNGSFYDFEVVYFKGTAEEVLITPPDDWGGRAAVKWAAQLAESDEFDPAAYGYIKVAEVMDIIYGRNGN